MVVEVDLVVDQNVVDFQERRAAVELLRALRVVSDAFGDRFGADFVQRELEDGPALDPREFGDDCGYARGLHSSVKELSKTESKKLSTSKFKSRCIKLGFLKRFW